MVSAISSAEIIWLSPASVERRFLLHAVRAAQPNIISTARSTARVLFMVKPPIYLLYMTHASVSIVYYII